jgi:hypothetical protein
LQSKVENIDFFLKIRDFLYIIDNKVKNYNDVEEKNDKKNFIENLIEMFEVEEKLASVKSFYYYYFFIYLFVFFIIY